jgi:hypothetical protein
MRLREQQLKQAYELKELLRQLREDIVKLQRLQA